VRYGGAHNTKKEMLPQLVTMLRMESHSVVQRRAAIVASMEVGIVQKKFIASAPFFVICVFFFKEYRVMPFLCELFLTNCSFVFLVNVSKILLIFIQMR
jgi:hypothetical protein